MPRNVVAEKISAICDFEDGSFEKLMKQFGFNEEGDGIYKMVFKAPGKQDNHIETTILIDSKTFHVSKLKFHMLPDDIDHVMVIILLLACNAVKHKEGVSKGFVSVSYDPDDGLIVSDVCHDKDNKPIPIKDEWINSALQKCVTPLWASTSNSITLWTLDKLTRHIGGEGLKILKSGNNPHEFVLKLKLCKNGG